MVMVVAAAGGAGRGGAGYSICGALPRVIYLTTLATFHRMSSSVASSCNRRGTMSALMMACTHSQHPRAAVAARESE